MTWTSRIPEYQARLDVAVQRGLLNAAMIYQNEVKKELAGGYTSGKFTTGFAINHVTTSELVKEGDSYSISVGTNLLYMLYWELGHHNIFTKHFERVEIWRPTFDAQTDAMKTAIKDEIASITI